MQGETMRDIEKVDEDSLLESTSAGMAEALDKLRRVAALDTTVLVVGESGTGKELAARFLHRRHPRRRQNPLVSVHCGRFRKRSSRASSSATSRERSPGPTATASASSSRPTAARSSSTRSPP